LPVTRRRDPQVFVENSVVVCDLVGGALMDDVALLKDIRVVGDLECDWDVLFDE
jgi:hypothetical protein